MVLSAICFSLIQQNFSMNVKDKFEKRILCNATNIPTFWLRFDADTFVIWPHGPCAFLLYLNCQHPNISSTMEKEKDRHLPFSDFEVYGKPDGTFGHFVYRKKTHTIRCLHAKSHHYALQKMFLISNLVGPNSVLLL